MIRSLATLLLLAQDETQILELEVTIGKRPAGAPRNPYLVKFAPREPLKLDGKAIDAAKLRPALEKALSYLFDQQEKDGAWRYNAKTQVRADVPQNERTFQAVAAQSVSPVVLTSLCSMALRAHEELAPDKIKRAVEKGLQFVLAQGPGYRGRDYAVWTWSFATSFLCDEHRRAKDPELKSCIADAVKTLAERILRDQRQGAVEARALPEKTPRERALDPKDSWTEKMRESQEGMIGAQPSMNPDDKEGVAIQSVTKDGPAAKAGIQPGDRILEIDGHEIRGVGQLLDIVDSLEPGKAVKVKVSRAPPGKKNERRPVPQDGGWSYYSWSESMTFTTATAILALLDAKSIGVDVPPGEIDRAVRMLEGARFRKEGMSEDGFVYRLHANKGTMLDIRGAIGRVSVCMLALLRGGKADAASAAEAVETFVRRRGELDRVRGYPGNHFVRSFANAAYYFLYGHYYAALALNSLEDPALKKKYGAFIQEALVATQWPEGTWTDHAAWGQLSGTALAVMALGQLKFVTPDAYKAPLPGEEY